MISTNIQAQCLLTVDQLNWLLREAMQNVRQRTTPNALFGPKMQGRIRLAAGQMCQPRSSRRMLCFLPPDSVFGVGSERTQHSS